MIPRNHGPAINPAHRFRACTHGLTAPWVNSTANSVIARVSARITGIAIKISRFHGWFAASSPM